MLAITQPLRVGDWVTFEDQLRRRRGRAAELHGPAHAGRPRVVIPNEQLAGGILRNDTLGERESALDVRVWLPPDARRRTRASRSLREATEQTVTVAEVTTEGVRLAVAGDPVPPPERAAREAELRAACLARLRAEGLLDAPEQGFPPLRRTRQGAYTRGFAPS